MLPFVRQLGNVLDTQNDATPFDSDFAWLHFQRGQNLEVRSEDSGKKR